MIKRGLVDRNKVVTIQNSYDLSKDFYNYASNFKEAGLKVAYEMIRSANIAKLDTMFFPVTFLYRHSIELILKAIAFKYIKNEDERITFLKETFHNLSALLNTVEPFIKKITVKDTECYQWLHSLLKSMNDIDKESDSFRYPFSIIRDKNHKQQYRAKWFFEKQTHINLVHLVNKMEIAFDILNTYYKEQGLETDSYKNFNSVFLEEGGDYYGQSVIGYRYNRSEMYIYIDAYKDSAKFLYDEILSDPKKMNSNFFPLCYLYKNAIELSLKDIILLVYPTEEALEKIAKRKHNIMKLWKCIEKHILKHADGSESDPIFIAKKNAMKEIHELDANADKFRYPIDKKMNYHFSGTKKYNIESYNNFFNQLISFMSGMSAMISDHNDTLADLEMEMKSNYDYGDYY